jgi:hypothetical protein
MGGEEALRARMTPTARNHSSGGKFAMSAAPQPAALYQPYFSLTFANSWDGFLLVGTPGLFAGTNWQTDPAFLLAVQAMLAGPPIADALRRPGSIGPKKSQR